MKPNSDKAGDMFVTPMMLEQLRYSGLLEVCTIRKMGERGMMGVWGCEMADLKLTLIHHSVPRYKDCLYIFSGYSAMRKA